MTKSAKYALVIGNNYPTPDTIGELKNSLNDAEDMATALQMLGFVVNKVLNGNRVDMQNAITQLKTLLSESKISYGFVFYAGHGVQSSGENYLIPVNADIPSENYLPERSISLHIILNELNDANNRLNIVVLDACRNNPYRWARNGNRGLATVHPPKSSVIVYATAAGDVADDGKGRNGLFTEHLLKYLRIPNLEIQEIFRLTMGDVERVSNYKQRPGVYNQFSGVAYLGEIPLQNDNFYANVLPYIRNIKLRVGSIQTILENISSKPADLSEKLREIGKKAGDNFVREVLKKLSNKELTDEDNPNSKKRIKGWLNLENLSGWGYFEIDHFDDIPPDSRIQIYNGQINVTNCFLSDNRDDPEKKLCSFLCGYMEKIITTIAEFPVFVTEIKCRCENHTDNQCWFNFKYDPDVR